MCEQAMTAAVLNNSTHKLSRVCHSQSPFRENKCTWISLSPAAVARGSSNRPNGAARGTWPALQDGHTQCGHPRRLGYSLA